MSFTTPPHPLVHPVTQDPTTVPPGPSSRWHTHPDPIRGGRFWCCNCRICDQHKEQVFFPVLPANHPRKADDTALFDRCTACDRMTAQMESDQAKLVKAFGYDPALALGLAALQLGQFRLPPFTRHLQYGVAAQAVMAVIFGQGPRAAVAWGLLSDKEESPMVMTTVLYCEGQCIQVPA